MPNRCAEIKLRAERRARELLAESKKNPGQLRRGVTMEPRADAEPLADVGISKLQSHRWQAVAHHVLELCSIVFRSFDISLFVRASHEFES